MNNYSFKIGSNVLKSVYSLQVASQTPQPPHIVHDTECVQQYGLPTYDCFIWISDKKYSCVVQHIMMIMLPLEALWYTSWRQFLNFDFIKQIFTNRTWSCNQTMSFDSKHQSCICKARTASVGRSILNLPLFLVGLEIHMYIHVFGGHVKSSRSKDKYLQVPLHHSIPLKNFKNNIKYYWNNYTLVET